MRKKYLKSDKKENGFRTQIYQATLLNKEFAFPINVVIVLNTHLSTKTQAHVILFSTDLILSDEKIMDFYTLRFQIGFNFRHAKQYWGLDGLKNLKQTAVTNVANLSFFIVNFSSILWRRFRNHHLLRSALQSRHACARFTNQTRHSI